MMGGAVMKNNIKLVTSWDEAPVVMDLPLAGRILGKTPESLKKRAQDGKLAGAFKDGGVWRVNRDQLRAYTEGRAV